MRRVGIDLALRADHRAAVFDDGVLRGRPFRVERTKAGIDELERRGTDGTDGPCEFVMEPTGLAWLPVAAELARRGHRAYVPKPQKTHALRKFYAQHTKTDGRDAQTLALVRHVDGAGVHLLRIPSASATSLRLAVKQRARLVAQAATSKNRVHGWLLLASPHLSEALGSEPFSRVATAFLRRHVDPFTVRALGRDGLHRFWRRQAGSAGDTRADAVWAASEKACDLYAGLRADGALPFDYADLQALIAGELEHIAFLEEQVALLEASIARRYRELDPERTLEREVPGVGPTIAAAIEALVGQVERFSSVKHFAAFCGLVPRTRQTGGVERPRQGLSKGGSNLLKQYLFLAADTARRRDPELAATYARVTARGRHHYSAVVVVAHKLARRVFAVLRLRAEARAAIAAGQTAPEVRYRLADPDNGNALSPPDARALVLARYPSKAQLARRSRAKGEEAADPIASSTGSSEDATKRNEDPPPASPVPEPGPEEKTVRNAVDNYVHNR